jgi:hypothetical protein
LALLANSDVTEEVRAHVRACRICAEKIANLEGVLDIAAYVSQESKMLEPSEPLPEMFKMSQRVFAKVKAAWHERRRPVVPAAAMIAPSPPPAPAPCAAVSHLASQNPWHGFVRPAGIIAAAVLAQWLISWTVLWWFDYGSLSRIDWWQAMTRGLLYTGILLASILAAARLIRRRRPSWQGVTMLVVLAISLGSSLGFAHLQHEHIRADLNAMFVGHRWVAYDPPGYNPYPGEERMPTPEEMERELRLLCDEKSGTGFDALITFKAMGTMAQIPELAKKVGFRKVIMGVWVPFKKGKLDKEALDEQIKAAVKAKKFVDGYCLGHNVPGEIKIETLKEWMADLRRKTGKPVSTTARLVNYLGERGKELREIGDWYFPDVRGSWVRGVPPEKLMEELEQAVRDVTTLPPDRPVLLKMISCPAKGSRYTPEIQADFYRWVQREDFFLPPGVFLSYYNGFDIPWMRHDKHPEWSPGQQYVGFFTADGEPRPSVAVVREGFPIQRRP